MRYMEEQIDRQTDTKKIKKRLIKLLAEVEKAEAFVKNQQFN